MNKTNSITKKALPHTHRSRLKTVHHSAAWMIVAAWAVVGVLTGVFLINRGRISQFGSQASEGKATFLVTNVRYDAVGTTPYKAPPGLKFAIVTVTIKNSSPEIFDFAPVLQTQVIDEKGQSWPMAPAMMDKPIQAGPFPTNAQRTGTLSYLIPSDAQKVTLKFDPMLANGLSSQFILGQ